MYHGRYNALVTTAPLHFTVVPGSSALPSVVPQTGTADEAMAFAKRHQCVVLLYDREYARQTGLSPFRGSIGPDGTHTKQDLNKPGQSVQAKCTYRTRTGGTEPDEAIHEVHVWGEKRASPTVQFRGHIDGVSVTSSFRTADAEGWSIEECIAPRTYVLVFKHKDSPHAVKCLVLDGDALAAAVDLAAMSTVDGDVNVYTLHRPLGDALDVGKAVPPGYLDREPRQRVAIARKRGAAPGDTLWPMD